MRGSMAPDGSVPADAGRAHAGDGVTWRLGFLLLVAAPAMAQDVPFAPTPVEACLAAAEDLPGREACVGRAAEACIESPAGSSNAGIGACFGREADWWQARLDTAYGALAAIEAAASADLAAMGSAAPSTADALAAMQQAWLAWRVAACDYEVSQWGGGSGGGPAGEQCRMAMTGRQAIALEARQRQAAGP